MRVFVSLLFLMFSLVSFAQDGVRIMMQNENGVYKVPCLVNGAKMKFIFDTGASTVSLSTTMATYLLENDYISLDDVIGSGKSVVADGSVVEHTVINLKDIEIGGLHLRNVKATVVNSATAPLLLGQTAIQKLGRIELDGNVLIIKQGIADAQKDEAYIEELFRKAINFYDMGLYEKASEVYEELYGLNTLTVNGVYAYIKTLWYSENYKKAYEVINEITDYQAFVDKNCDIYDMAGGVCWTLGKYMEAIAYFKLSYTHFTDWESRAEVLAAMAGVYSAMEDHKNAFNEYMNAMKCMEKYYGLEEGYLMRDCMGKLGKKEKSYKNENVEYWMFGATYQLYKNGGIDFETMIYNVRALAKNKNAEAVKYLNNVGLSIDGSW